MTRILDIEGLSGEEKRAQHIAQMAELGATLALLSHEIKNPLASILAGLQVLEREVGEEDELKMVVEDVLGDVRRLAGLLRELLELAQPPQMKPSPERLSLLLRDPVRAAVELAAGRGTTFNYPDTEPRVGDILVTVDATLFKRALSSLLLNAIEAAGRGGRVELFWEQLTLEQVGQHFPGFPGDVVAVAIADNGPGVPPEIRGNIFKPFFTTKPRGTGLGLPLAQQVVERHGGVLDPDLSPNHGAVFRIYLPVSSDLPCYDLQDHDDIRCDSCAIQLGNTGYCCFTLRTENEQNSQTGMSECASCPVYERGDLLHYVRPSARTDKQTSTKGD